MIPTSLSRYRLRTASWTIAAALLILFAVSLSDANAQADPDTTVAPPDSIPIGYQQILSQLRSLQPIPQLAPDPAEGDIDGISMLEIDGLVVDETQTRLGRDFYEVFFSNWEVPEGAVNFTVVIEEHPMPNLGTRIVVRVDDEVSFQAQLRPQYDFIQEAARFAVFRTQQFVERAEGGRQIY